ncbi:amidase [Gracilibacillus sp. S3-1-1]|uniref:Amidase n=1 Tax=Gracilibacillus pellucidus TaxID=3095368 RepID=A0ACC6M0Z8_9BACI|nr:amidase [Gracilibacillus sp. S3-1-1]MDX8044623.1 amidase [Gracilibacillus sp. S3-1-1]
MKVKQVLTLAEILQGYKQKEFSPIEITEMYLDRIERVNKKINAFITVSSEHALNQAKTTTTEWMKGYQSLPLQGIPISYKDLINTNGIVTTSGSQINQQYVPHSDADVVRQLDHAGAINLGKNNLHEYAFGITSTNPFYGAVRNPWNVDYIPGGSSGGSAAAVAAHLGVASVGTDTGGSIRIPAAATGVVGMKLTKDRLSTKGIQGISWSLDHVGPMTLNMTDMAMMLEALTNKPYQKHCRSDIRGLRIGVPTNFFNEHIEPEVYDLYKKALKEYEQLGAILVDIDLLFAEEASNLVFVLAIAEGGYLHRDNLANKIDQFGEDVRALLVSHEQYTAMDYIHALNKQEQFKSQVDELFVNVDVIATPTLPVSPQRIGAEMVKTNGLEEDIFSCMTRYTRLFSLTGHPALSIPMGLTEAGLPAGLQLVGPYNHESVLVRAGYAFEVNTLVDFYKQRTINAENL